MPHLYAPKGRLAFRDRDKDLQIAHLSTTTNGLNICKSVKITRNINARLRLLQQVS